MINSSSDNVKKLNSINRRMFITGSLKFLIMIGLVSRLFFLQVKENKKYLTLSDKNRIREWKLPPIRGEFKDYFGNTIAGNFEAYQLHIIPEEVEDFRYVIYRVKELLELSEKKFQKILIFSYIILLAEALNPLFYLQGINKILPQSILNFFSKSIYIILIILYISDAEDAYLANFFYGISISFLFLIFWIKWCSVAIKF